MHEGKRLYGVSKRVSDGSWTEIRDGKDDTNEKFQPLST